MKRFLTALALMLCAAPAMAADKGGPPAKINIDGSLKPMFTGCYVGGNAGGVAMTAAGDSLSAATFGVEAGCDLQQSVLVFGVRAGYDFGEADFRGATIAGRIGYTINTHSIVYGILAYTTDGRSPKINDGILSAGAGLELYAFTPKTSLYVEALKDIRGVGEAKDIGDAWSVKVGARWRF